MHAVNKTLLYVIPQRINIYSRADCCESFLLLFISHIRFNLSREFFILMFYICELIYLQVFYPNGRLENRKSIRIWSLCRFKFRVSGNDRLDNETVTAVARDYGLHQMHGNVTLCSKVFHILDRNNR